MEENENDVQKENEQNANPNNNGGQKITISLIAIILMIVLGMGVGVGLLINRKTQTNKSNNTVSNVTNNTEKNESNSTENNTVNVATTESKNDVKNEISRLVKAHSPSGWAGSSMQEIRLYANGNVYHVSYNGEGDKDENIVRSELIAQGAEDIEYKENENGNHGFEAIIVKGKNLKILNETYSWVTFEKNSNTQNKTTYTNNSNDVKNSSSENEEQNTNNLFDGIIGQNIKSIQICDIEDGSQDEYNINNIDLQNLKSIATILKSSTVLTEDKYPREWYCNESVRIDYNNSYELLIFYNESSNIMDVVLFTDARRRCKFLVGNKH